jgi:DNA-binding LacI/PurR family transcriptional regulator
LLKDSTAERVRTYAASVNYVPNRAARNLKRQSSGMIGWVVPSMTSTANAELLDALYLRMFEAGYDLQVHLSQASVKQEARAIRQCLTAQVEGLIVTPSFPDFAALPTDHPLVELSERRFPCVYLSGPMPGCATVSRSPRQAVADAYAHLRAQGYEDVRLLTLTNAATPLAEQSRYQGFRDAVLAEGRSFDPAAVLALETVMERVASGGADGGAERQYRHDNRRVVAYGEALAEMALETPPSRPLGLICNNDQVAAGAMRVCRARRLRVPEDVGLVGCDDSAGAELDLTSVRWDNVAMTAAIVDSVHAQLGGVYGQQTVAVGGELVVRGSSRLRGEAS